MSIERADKITIWLRPNPSMQECVHDIFTEEEGKMEGTPPLPFFTQGAPHGPGERCLSTLKEYYNRLQIRRDDFSHLLAYSFKIWFIAWEELILG
jgi:hypothetical protein